MKCQGHLPLDGLGLCFFSTVVQCAQIVLSGSLMSTGTTRLDGLQMTAFTGPLALLALLPAALASEARVLSVALAERPAATLGVLLGTSVIAVAYNVVLYQTIVTIAA